MFILYQISYFQSKMNINKCRENTEIVRVSLDDIVGVNHRLLLVLLVLDFYESSESDKGGSKGSGSKGKELNQTLKKVKFNTA